MIRSDKTDKKMCRLEGKRSVLKAGFFLNLFAFIFVFIAFGTPYWSVLFEYHLSLQVIQVWGCRGALNSNFENRKNGQKYLCAAARNSGKLFFWGGGGGHKVPPW